MVVAILGYGSQGRALALNLRDSGFDVRIGLKTKSKSRTRARRDGFSAISTVARTVPKADVICFALPDHLHGRIYSRDVLPYLRPGTTLVFLHGLSVHFGLVTPPVDCDVILIAPHGPGTAVREKYLSDHSVSAFYAVGQNPSGNARQTAFALAAGMGFRKNRLVKTTFEAEALGDMFGEQAVLCGGLAMLIKNGFQVLVENGLPPDAAYLEVAYQLDLIVGLIKRHGIEGMFKRISVAARFGSVENGPRVIGADVKKRMQRVYREIKSGRFANKLADLDESSITLVDKALKNLTDPEFEKAARRFSR